jgi:tRNA(fMet)-specific endonuclease VapC
MNGHLLDTDICIAYFKAVPSVVARFKAMREPALFVSEITLAELKYGAFRSKRPAHHLRVVADFLDSVSVLPITPVIDRFAEEKARLTALGTIIPDFDLLIGATAVHHGLALVTNNMRHFKRIHGIELEEWMR